MVLIVEVFIAQNSFLFESSITWIFWTVSITENNREVLKQSLKKRVT